MSLTILIFGGLVTWRLANMLVREHGPLGVFDRLHAFLAIRQKRHGGLFDMISCVACMSIYIGAVVALWPAGDVFEWFVYTLSFSAIATVIDALIRK